jgi:hypothetical protein
VAFLDIEKAFDSFDHAELLKILAARLPAEWIEIMRRLLIGNSRVGLARYGRDSVIKKILKHPEHSDCLRSRDTAGSGLCFQGTALSPQRYASVLWTILRSHCGSSLCTILARSGPLGSSLKT